MAELFWWMTGGAAVVWLGGLILAFYAVRALPIRAASVRRSC